MMRLRSKPLLLIEAVLALGLAAALIKICPFRTIAKLAAGKGAGEYLPASSAEAELIGRAVRAGAMRVPWRAVCFQQGLAALLMLRRRRLAATLYYGAAHGAEAALVAHVWVKSASVAVVGCETAGDFRLLAEFPSRSD